MKKFALTLLFLLALALPAVAADNVVVVINGEILVSDAEAEIVEGRTYVPLRAIAEALGAEVGWNPESMGITLKNDDAETDLAIGSLSASITEGNKVSPVQLEAAPYIKDDRTFVPLRFIAQGLGSKVYWCDELKTAVITEDYKQATGNLREILDPYLSIDLPTAIKADNAKLAEDIIENPESVMNYFYDLWVDRSLTVLKDEMTEAEKNEYTELADDFNKQWNFLSEMEVKYNIPIVDCPVKMCAVKNNGVSAVIIDAPTVRTIDIAPQFAFLSQDGSVVAVRL